MSQKLAIITTGCYDTQHNDIQYNDTQPKRLIFDAQHSAYTTLSITMLCQYRVFLLYYAVCHYAECHYAECSYAECCGAHHKAHTEFSKGGISVTHFIPFYFFVYELIKLFNGHGKLTERKTSYYHRLPK